MDLRSTPHALVLSPMVDVTDAAFRSVAKEWGADITCSEMVSAAGIVHDNATSRALARPWPDGESPYGVQLMSGDPAEMADAVRRVVTDIRPDFIDLNLGCPSPNILRSCAGGFLLRDPKKAGRVIQAAVDAVEEIGPVRRPHGPDGPLATETFVPKISVKMRMGHDHDHLTYLDVGTEAQAAGAAWCTLHGRTVAQMYSGDADWDAIRRLVDHLDIPVVGNGDIRGPDDVVAMRDRTGCQGFFIARAAMHDPTIFHRLRQALDGKVPEDGPDLPERVQTFLTYMDRAERIGIDHVAGLRRQGTRFMSGVPGAKTIRKALHDAQTASEVRTAVTRLLEAPV